jgi:beta-galactosidase/beta-glucuronidase
VKYDDDGKRRASLGMTIASSTRIPRPEYPRPHRARPRWLNLNGEWEFAFDDADRGRRDGWESGQTFPLRITVPFSFEAALSGIGERAIHPVIWYRRLVEIPAGFLHERLLLHIGACDFAAQVWVNGRCVGMHRGGYAPITCEIQHAARPGSNEVVIRVEDRPVWSQPRGKQIVGEAPVFIDYDRVTGIWQTVWLEPVPNTFVEDVWSRFALETERLSVNVQCNQEFDGAIEVVATFAGALVARARAFIAQRREVRVDLAIAQPRLWCPNDPALYDLTINVLDGERGVDAVTTYAGLRRFTRKGRTIRLNGAPFYFRAVLDQGYFPGGWYTAATDDDLKRDITLMQAMGFNGARKHQKAEDPRWLYWADRLGFVVWSEMPSGRAFGTALVEDCTREWLELVRRDRMHPAIMTWVPLNESWGIDAVAHSPRQRQWVRALYHLTRSLDPTRFVIANDGWEFLTGDIWGLHHYATSGADLAICLRQVLGDPATEVAPGRRAALPGANVGDLPVMLTECGGLALRDPRPGGAPEDAWGYAQVANAAELERRIGDLMHAVRVQPNYSGFVWTQFADVQQEINGLVYFDRTPKLPLAVLRAIFSPIPTG